ncbi:TPA: D-hexose-6-phosphate mutarotase [Pseudomonas aeruginosa]|uniref:D-hexose-6-phosphate mutarotase n=1 Tax=Pseudomonas aeruginosa TaxID=287 RepID=UPI000F5333C5|nr:D-hexose-6-phosphate mutarotase [Pseudomonas aeruginosa]MBG4184898.1 D-hexose-6-phosphate mutarotase [Pseudomonas aeruginosa]MDY1250436.1 D-hexose-6-phosphate mutarotase [Pseudomonas aeruginosa]QEK88839.1 D-hexose-6-phosphate mutarotase [Pseudomonas aeruginosa]RQD03282.1 D-hexose-6-phosphate mutarotase [Pseudomonas aeruginosa]RTW43847.1 D-hexose-6-phosphate mutarotase [Pseudomonas aeruginosa]
MILLPSIRLPETAMNTDSPINRVEQVQVDDLACWRIHTAHGEALIAQQGAQLLSYQPHEQPPLVWLSDEAGYRRGQSVRGGVPVCWPWFGPLERNPQEVRGQVEDGLKAPAHGLVRAVDWEIDDIAEKDGDLCVSFRLDAPDGLPGWPHPAALRMLFRFGERLTLRLTSENLGSKPLVLSQALHTYFAVSDSREIAIEGLEGARYIETLENWEERTQHGAVRVKGELDRIYLGLERDLLIKDPRWERSIHLHALDSRSAVVWNPWVDKSRRLSQFADDAWQQMLCIETGRVWDDLMVVAPGRSESFGVQIWSEPLKRP